MFDLIDKYFPCSCLIEACDKKNYKSVKYSTVYMFWSSILIKQVVPFHNCQIIVTFSHLFAVSYLNIKMAADRDSLAYCVTE